VDRFGAPVTIGLLGPDSATYRRLQREQVQRRLARAAATNGAPPDAATFESDENDATGMLVALTIRWAGVNTPAGEAIPCTPEAVRSLYDRYPAIRDQVDTWVVARRNFMTALPAA
jgi:hypothetical protein